MQKTFKSFPDLAKGMQGMKLGFKLDEISDQTILGYSIRCARLKERPLKEIAETIYSQYQDAPDVVLDVVPQETIDLIKSIYYAE